MVDRRAAGLPLEHILGWAEFCGLRIAVPLVARVATNGPTVRPVWFLWECGAFRWITGSYARLPGLLADDPRIALVIDTCDFTWATTRKHGPRNSARSARTPGLYAWSPSA